MASKVLVPTAPFAKLQIKQKSPPETSASSGTGFIISGDGAGRVAHLEHSVRFLQEQHRLMLSGLHQEIEALRERNRDLQFQLIFNKESSPKTSPTSDDSGENCEESRLKREIARLEREAAAARGEARAAEARALQLQRLVDAQAEKIRELELKPKCPECTEPTPGEGAESRAELRARLADAERLVRRLRGDADRQRREVSGAGVTNLLFDDAAARQAHLQCMKNSLQASLRASGLEAGFGFHNSYQFPPVQHTPDFWREPLREDYNLMGSRGRNNRRPLTLPDLSATGHQIHRSTVYANNHTRPRANGYENKNKKAQAHNSENVNVKSPEELAEWNNWKVMGRLHTKNDDIKTNMPDKAKKHILPEMKMVVTKLLPDVKGEVTNGQTSDGAGRPRPRRHHHRKHASTDHT